MCDRCHSQVRLTVLLLSAVGLLSPCAQGQAQKGMKGVTHQQRRAERPRRWAVLIGVDTYEDEQGIGSLKYCASDMKLLYSVLTGPNGGFAPENVLLMTDAATEVLHRPTYTNLVSMIPRWIEDAEPQDDVLIAFSGHGITRDGKCYLLPRDAKRSAPRLTSVSVPQIREWLESCRAGRKVLVLDACHAGAGKESSTMGREWAEELERGEGFLRLASCNTHQKSNEDAHLGYGVFTYYLAEALKGAGDYDRDGRVGADEAFRYVSRAVQQWARSKGLRQDPLMSGRVAGGMFTLCYVPRAGGTEVRVPEPRPVHRPAPAPVTGKLPAGFMLPTSDTDQRGNPVVKRGGSSVDPKTGHPYEIWLKEPRMEFVLVPAGEFMMGSNDGASDEKPVHKVRIAQPFYVGKYEVTQAQYEAVVGKNPSNFKGAHSPVEQVSWVDVTKCVRRLSEQSAAGIALPTEAQWEYACRAGSTGKYCFGDDASTLKDYAWYEDNSGSSTHPVGQKKPNAWGMHDMHGNVWEWCSSKYESYPYNADDGREDINDAGSARVLRGGSWDIDVTHCRSANRYVGRPSNRYGRVGFRVVVSSARAPR